VTGSLLVEVVVRAGCVGRDWGRTLLPGVRLWPAARPWLTGLWLLISQKV